MTLTVGICSELFLAPNRPYCAWKVAVKGIYVFACLCSAPCIIAWVTVDSGLPAFHIEACCTNICRASYIYIYIYMKLGILQLQSLGVWVYGNNNNNLRTVFTVLYHLIIWFNQAISSKPCARVHSGHPSESRPAPCGRQLVGQDAN